jgi:hypothetical protein
MGLKRKALHFTRLEKATAHNAFVQDQENVVADAFEQDRSQRASSNWLPTISSYMSWIFTASIVWEISWLPQRPVWVSGNTEQIALFTIQAINADLLIALGTLFAALVIFGNNRWPTEGYQRVCLVTIAVAWGFSAISLWLFPDGSEKASEGIAMWTEENPYTIIAAHLKWIVLPAAAFWQASHIKQSSSSSH